MFARSLVVVGICRGGRRRCRRWWLRTFRTNVWEKKRWKGASLAPVALRDRPAFDCNVPSTRQMGNIFQLNRKMRHTAFSVHAPVSCIYAKSVRGLHNPRLFRCISAVIMPPHEQSPSSMAVCSHRHQIDEMCIIIKSCPLHYLFSFHSKFCRRQPCKYILQSVTTIYTAATNTTRRFTFSANSSTADPCERRSKPLAHPTHSAMAHQNSFAEADSDPDTGFLSWLLWNIP